MKKKDPRVNAYIAAAAPFARPILKHLREVVHVGCPAAHRDVDRMVCAGKDADVEIPIDTLT